MMIQWSELKEQEVKACGLTSSFKIKSQGSRIEEYVDGECKRGKFRIRRNLIPRERKYKVIYFFGGYMSVIGKAYKLEDAKRIAEEYYQERFSKELPY